MVKDWAYIAAFKPRDLPSLREMIQHIRETHDTDMIEDINQRFERQAPILKNGIRIESISKSEDLVVDSGVNRCIDLILQTNTNRWRYMMTGIGASRNPLVTDTALNSEIMPRIDMTVDGWIEPKGMKILFGAIRGESHEAQQVSELGIYTVKSGAGTLLNRNNFTQNSLVRNQDSNVFIFSSVVELCPVS